MLSSSFSSRKMRTKFRIIWEIDIVHAVERCICGSNKCQIRLFLSCPTSWHTKFDAPYYTETWRYDYQRHFDSSYKLLLGSFGIKRLFCNALVPWPFWELFCVPTPPTLAFLVSGVLGASCSIDFHTLHSIAGWSEDYSAKCVVEYGCFIQGLWSCDSAVYLSAWPH